MSKIIVTLIAFFGTSLLNAIVPYDHIHLTATNAEEAVAWYTKHFGGVAGRASVRPGGRGPGPSGLA